MWQNHEIAEWSVIKLTKVESYKNETFLFLSMKLWDNTPLFVKYNPGLLDLLVLLDETGLQTGL